MPQRALSYYFSLQSPWSYLGHDVLINLVSRHGLRLAWKPLNLLALFPESGGLPLAKRHPLRVAYRTVELQRWRDLRQVPLNVRPAYWPVDIARADRIVVALAGSGSDPDPFVRRAFAALWAEDRNLADEIVLADLLAGAGLNAGDVLARADAVATLATYEDNLKEALSSGVFGAPTYLLDGEPFWGQDRIELLEEALASGRAPITA